MAVENLIRLPAAGAILGQSFIGTACSARRARLIAQPAMVKVRPPFAGAVALRQVDCVWRYD
jgi:hypothetical protein